MKGSGKPCKSENDREGESVRWCDSKRDTERKATVRKGKLRKSGEVRTGDTLEGRVIKRRWETLRKEKYKIRERDTEALG